MGNIIKIKKEVNQIYSIWYIESFVVIEICKTSHV